MTPRNSNPNPEIHPNASQAGRVVLEEIARSESLPATIAAEEAFAAIMCGLEAALGDDGAQRLERDLPASIRKLVGGCSAHPQDKPQRLTNAGEFLQAVSEHLQLEQAQAEELTQVVFHALHRLMSVGEVQGFARELPADMRGLWSAGDDHGESIRASRLD